MSRDNYNPYRIVGAKKIDVWFYEEGDMRRTHRIVYEPVSYTHLFSPKQIIRHFNNFSACIRQIDSSLNIC